ncbi:MAG: hypothetical protein MZW92_24215 [Comamonadaceae bacterium]|nr:hypothetical protein [Comamonadaceae bacterium]
MSQFISGGRGGDTDGGMAGGGGDALSRLSFADRAATSMYLETRATGGGGGDAGGTGSAAAGGHASATAVGSGAGTVRIESSAQGGKGGNAMLGDGGHGGGAAASATLAGADATGSSAGVCHRRQGGSARGVGARGGGGGSAVASASGPGDRTMLLQLHAVVSGGNGGAGFAGADGGNGAAVTADNSVSGFGADTALRLYQHAYGGHGGGSEDAVAAAGGAAISSVWLRDAGAFNVGSVPRVATAAARRVAPQTAAVAARRTRWPGDLAKSTCPSWARAAAAGAGATFVAAGARLLARAAAMPGPVAPGARRPERSHEWRSAPTAAAAAPAGAPGIRAATVAAPTAQPMRTPVSRCPAHEPIATLVVRGGDGGEGQAGAAGGRGSDVSVKRRGRRRLVRGLADEAACRWRCRWGFGHRARWRRRQLLQRPEPRRSLGALGSRRGRHDRR